MESRKTCPWVVNSDETKKIKLSYTGQNCAIIYSTESNRRKRSTGDGIATDHVTEMTFHSNDTHFEVEASIYGPDLCLKNLPDTNAETHIHGSIGENTCKDDIYLEIDGTETNVLPTSHISITLSNKFFYTNQNDTLSLTLNTLNNDELESKLSAIQCGVTNDVENPV